METKKTYNNYQFYETPALTKYLKEQSIKGYSFCGAVGEFLDVLKFHHLEDKTSKSFIILRKRLDEHIDEKIKEMKNNKTEIIHENNTYIVFAKNFDEDTELQSIIKKQNVLQAVSIKKSVAFISILLIISVISLVLNILWLQNTNVVLNSLNVGVCISLIINFLIYFIGDLHDYFSGKAVTTDGKIIFNDRSKLKDTLFRIGDVLKFAILLVSIFLSIKVVLQASDPAVTVNVLKNVADILYYGICFKDKIPKIIYRIAFY